MISEVILQIVSIFQLPNADRYPDIKDLMKYLQTDNNTSVDTLSRFTANVVVLLRDVLKFKYSLNSCLVYP